MERPYVKILIPFAEEICRWVRFGKRTHREQFFGEVWKQLGEILSIFCYFRSAALHSPLWLRFGREFSTKHPRDSSGEVTAGSIKQNQHKKETPSWE